MEFIDKNKWNDIDKEENGMECNGILLILLSYIFISITSNKHGIILKGNKNSFH